jgi:hypothetical protein
MIGNEIVKYEVHCTEELSDIDVDVQQILLIDIHFYFQEEYHCNKVIRNLADVWQNFAAGVGTDWEKNPKLKVVEMKY